jgi:F-type H+-transporting ATPase subunit delta
MKPSKLYAQVLVDAAQGQLATVKEDLQKFQIMWNESPLLVQVLSNPTISDEEKGKVTESLLKKLSLSKLAERFVILLVKRNRANLLREIFLELSSIQVSREGGLLGELVTAVSVEPSVIEGVALALSKKLNKKVILTERVDASLIAGMRVTVGGVSYDGSIQGKINQLQSQFH